MSPHRTPPDGRGWWYLSHLRHTIQSTVYASTRHQTLSQLDVLREVVLDGRDDGLHELEEDDEVLLDGDLAAALLRRLHQLLHRVSVSEMKGTWCYRAQRHIAIDPGNAQENAPEYLALLRARFTNTQSIEKCKFHYAKLAF